MNRRYTLIFLLLLSGLFTLTTASAQSNTAQNSLIPNVSEDYLERLINIAKTNYPHVKSNNERINIAKTNVGKAKISWFDALTFSYIYQPNSAVVAASSGGNYNYFVNGIQAGVFLNIGTLLAKPYAIRQAKEELVIANNDQREYMITLELNVRTRYYTYLQRLVSLKSVTQSTIDAYNLAQSIRHKYEKGEETFDNYNRAQVSLAQQNELKIQGEASLLISKAELESLLGDKLENIK